MRKFQTETDQGLQKVPNKKKGSILKLKHHILNYRMKTILNIGGILD